MDTQSTRRSLKPLELQSHQGCLLFNKSYLLRTLGSLRLLLNAAGRGVARQHKDGAPGWLNIFRRVENAKPFVLSELRADIKDARVESVFHFRSVGGGTQAALSRVESVSCSAVARLAAHLHMKRATLADTSRGRVIGTLGASVTLATQATLGPV